jgi:hypothetical protein
MSKFKSFFKNKLINSLPKIMHSTIILLTIIQFMLCQLKHCKISHYKFFNFQISLYRCFAMIRSYQIVIMMYQLHFTF